MTARVLVVDDDARFRDLARRILTAAAIDISGEADSCASARAAAARLRPAGILVDARLPDGDGVALAAELMALPWSPRVVLTSSDSGVAAELEQRPVPGLVFVPKSDLPDAPVRELLMDEWQS